MSKKSFSDIEQIMKNAAEAHEPAFDEKAWKKMEALLDKDGYRRRPFIFWVWWLVPLLMGFGLLSYFGFNKNEKKQELTVQKKDNSSDEKTKSSFIEANRNSDIPGPTSITRNNSDVFKKAPDNSNTAENKDRPENKIKELSTVNKDKTYFRDNTKNRIDDENLFVAGKSADKTKGKTKATITASEPISETLADVPRPEAGDKSKNTDPVNTNTIQVAKPEEAVVIKIEAGKRNEKEIEKIIDSVVTKSVADKKTKTRISKFYVIVAAGAEASGVKLFSADKVTPRYGLALGFQINKNISVQGGFFVSNKKYIAGKEDYRPKEGSYWTMVDIKSIDANCRVYEIPLQVRYDFTPGKKLNIFATAGLSSYIMKKEDYNISYERYGTLHQAAVNYTGNRNFFAVLRLSAGAEKKISRQFAVFASPGIAIPMAGVGDGKVKLYSTDIMLGLKFAPARKNKR